MHNGIHEMRPALPGGGNRRDIRKAKDSKGQWEFPPQDPEFDLNTLMSILTGLEGIVMKQALDPNHPLHESFLAPYAPELFPLLFGISISQIGNVYKMEKNDGHIHRNGLFSLVQLIMMWQVGKIGLDAFTHHDAQSLTTSGICAAGIALGRQLNKKQKQK